jgi:hypothetical protein
LTQAESQYVYNVEVLGLPFKKAASMAGLTIGMTTKPHVMQARETVRRELRGQMAITKEDVLYGIKEAIDRAKIIAEPSTEIAGWKQISLMLGYDSPARLDINMRESIHVVQTHVRGMSDAALVDMLGAGNVIDGEFYEKPKEKITHEQ